MNFKAGDMVEFDHIDVRYGWRSTLERGMSGQRAIILNVQGADALRVQSLSLLVSTGPYAGRKISYPSSSAKVISRP